MRVVIGQRVVTRVLRRAPRNRLRVAVWMTRVASVGTVPVVVQATVRLHETVGLNVTVRCWLAPDVVAAVVVAGVVVSAAVRGALGVTRRDAGEGLEVPLVLVAVAVNVYS